MLPVWTLLRSRVTVQLDQQRLQQQTSDIMQLVGELAAAVSSSSPTTQHAQWSSLSSDSSVSCAHALLTHSSAGHSLAVQLAQELQQLGASLCGSIPLACVCNNPSCVALERHTEVQQVQKKWCSGCGGATHYCSAECAEQHWRSHKRVCKQLAAAAHAGPAAGSK